MKDIKEFLLNGCVIEMPYKTRKEDWVGKVVIHIYAGHSGVNSKVCICGDTKPMSYTLDLLDFAIHEFQNLVFHEKNLMYKRDSAIISLQAEHPNLDLENEQDSQLVETRRLELIQEEHELMWY